MTTQKRVIAQLTKKIKRKNSTPIRLSLTPELSDKLMYLSSALGGVEWTKCIEFSIAYLSDALKFQSEARPSGGNNAVSNTDQPSTDPEVVRE